VNKIAVLIRDRLTDARRLESLIDAGILVSLTITVLLTATLLSILQLSGAQSPVGFANAIAGSQTTTALTAPGHLTPVLLLVGVMAVALLSAYYAFVHRQN